MKKLTLLIIAVFSFILLNAANFSFLEHQVTQPDGTVIECYVSGDEFFNWIHDKDGYSIVKGSDGYYYYATKKEGIIVPSGYRVNSVNPDKVGIKKWIKISSEQYQKKKELFYQPLKNNVVNAPHTGNLNNLVVYIRFSGESEIATTRKVYDDKLNLETGVSLKAYYKEVSYNQLNINSTHYPVCAEPTTTNASYEDSHTRDYFRPYDASTNPTGYQNESERTQREHQLLADAIEWVNANHPIDAGLNIDGDNDGRVDNVCFMIKGNSDGWNDLLWAHRWALYTKSVYINGKRVYDYTFQPENQVSVRTLCHEMFHALGAPDLYHYQPEGANLDPVGQWDIMEQGGGHMGAYMKWKYADGNWITDIPEITTSGTYSLNPLTSSTNNCYKIASPYAADEYFVVEYRKQSGDFESSVPGNGLIVYRINTNFNGNAQYDGSTVFDEVYIYRPSGNIFVNGSINDAYFNSTVGRTSINDGTNPTSFLTDGSVGGLNISQIGTAGETISFQVSFKELENPENFSASGISETEITLSWSLNADSNPVMILYSEDGVFGVPEDGVEYNINDEITGGGKVLYKGSNTEFNHVSLNPSSYHYYKIFSINESTEYSYGEELTAATSCSADNFPLWEDFSDLLMPNCWQNVDNHGSGQIWEFGTADGFGSSSGDNGVAYLDSDGYGESGTQDADLITPSFDFTNMENVYVLFEHYFRYWENNGAEFYYTIDGGINWNLVQSWSETAGTWDNPSVFSQDLSAELAGYSNVQFKWKYWGSYGYYWIIDDIVITNDVTNPDVVIESSEDTETTVHPITLNIIFNEPVAGFEITDIALTNATASNLNAVSDSLYTVEIEPVQAGNINVNIAANVAQDAARNGNNAAETWSISFNYATGIPEVDDKAFKIFPNPSNGIINLEINSEFKIGTITIYDTAGKVVYKEKLTDTNKYIDISDQLKGIYILNVQLDNKIYSKKLIIN